MPYHPLNGDRGLGSFPWKVVCVVGTGNSHGFQHLFLLGQGPVVGGGIARRRESSAGLIGAWAGWEHADP